MISQEELEQIEISNKNAQVAIDKGEALKRLLATDDYKAIISEGYLKAYPIDLGMAIAGNTGAYDTDILVNNLKGINTFVGYIFKISASYHEAIQTIRDNTEFVASSSNDEE